MSGKPLARRKRAPPASRFKGLAWDKHEACWRVRVSLMGKQHHLGRCARHAGRCASAAASGPQRALPGVSGQAGPGRRCPRLSGGWVARGARSHKRHRTPMPTL